MQAVFRSIIDRETGEVISEKIIETVEIDDYYQPLAKIFYDRIKKRAATKSSNKK